MRRVSLLLIFLFGNISSAQSVTMPASVTVPVTRPFGEQVTVVWEGDDITWFASTGLGVIRVYSHDPRNVVFHVQGDKPGAYFLEAVAVKVVDGKARFSPKARCEVKVTGKEPTPDPDPPNPPDPDNPAPIPVEGFRVLMIFETEDLAKYKSGQLSVLYSTDIRKYMDSKCVGGKSGYRIWDKDESGTGHPQLWQDAMKRSRTTLPWLIVSNGKTGYEGPIPDSIQATMEILKKHGGN